MTVWERLFVMPFRENTTFVGREYILKQLQELLRPQSDRQSRAGLWGLGGIGSVVINLLADKY